MHTFFCFQNKGTKLFQGQSFTIDIAPFTTDIWTFMPLNSLSLNDFCNISYSDNINQATLIRLYDGVYFVHMNSIKGQLSLYQIIFEIQITQILSISLPPGKYGIISTDNLILMREQDLNITYVFDIKSSEYSNKPIATLFHVHKLINEVDSAPNSYAIHNAKAQNIYVENIFDRNSRFFDHDLCVDLDRGIVYKLKAHPEILVMNHPSKIEAILFLLRRNGCKANAFEFMKDCIHYKLELGQIGSLFTTINRVYKVAALERKNSKREERKSLPTSASSLNSPKLGKKNNLTDSELKIVSGMTVILQTDMHSLVFYPLYKEREDLFYLGNVILLYQKSLIDEDIQVHHIIQILLAKILIGNKEFTMLQQLIQHNLFADSIEFANLMIELSKNGEYPLAFQTGIDILFRLESFGTLAEAFLENGMIFEVLQLLEKHPCPGFDIKLLQAYSESLNDTQVSYLVSQFISHRPI